MKILMICNTDGALYVFRKPIIEAAIRAGHSVDSLSDRSDYFDRLKALGVHPVALDFSRHSVGVLDNLRLCLALWRGIRAVRPTVVHGFTHKPAIFGTLAARLAGVRPVFVTITGLGTLFIRPGFKAAVLRQLLLLQYRIALRFARRVFFQNPDDLDYFVASGVLPARKAVLTHGSGIDLREHALPSPDQVKQARATLQSELGVTMEDTLVVLFPARGVREKGFQEFYEAARVLNAQHPGRYLFLHLGLVDSASSGVVSREGIDAFARQCGVRYLGFKDDITRYMTACDIVALPSYREGTPRSLIEALALGKFIVTTDTPGCRETVRPGWNGLLCRVGSAQSLAEQLATVDQAMLSATPSRARAYCEEKYDAAKLVDLTLRSYQDAVPQAGTARP
jgi:N,N'-diacetylbacillosaminyl-diphospho-undecaprenol alpha-1,3-N-acetylgalactosaminyltransferase